MPEGHPLRSGLEALTRAEEAAGLYEETATIGFKLNWEKLLASKGLVIRGYELIEQCKAERGECDDGKPEAEREAQIVVERHNTAMTRYDLSKPVKTVRLHMRGEETSTRCVAETGLLKGKAKGLRLW